MTIDLRTCKPGDKLEMQNGKVVEYINSNGDSMYPHSVKMPIGMDAFFTDSGQFYIYRTSSTDIVKVIPMPTNSTIPQRGTKDFTKYAISVMMAYDRGEVIESAISNDWGDCDSPRWQWENVSYRIKPKPTVIPWTIATCQVGSVIKTKKGFNRGVVIGANKYYVFVFSKSYTYHDMLADWTMDDGEPCGTVQQ